MKIKSVFSRVLSYQSTDWQAFACYGLLVASVCSIALANLFLLLMLVGALVLKFPRLRAESFRVRADSFRIWAEVFKHKYWWCSVALWAYLLTITSIQFFVPTPLENWAWFNDQWLWLLIYVLIPFWQQVKLERLLKVYAGAVILIAVYGLAQYYWGIDLLRFGQQKIVIIGQFSEQTFFHAHGTFSHHLTYAGVLLMPLGLFSSLYLGQRKWWWALAATASGAGLLFSLSRAAWISSWLIALLLLLRISRFWSALFLVVSLGVFALLWAGYQQGSLLQALPPILEKQLETRLDQLPRPLYRVLSLQNDKNPRILLWQVAWHGIKAQPWLGRGLNPSSFHDYREKFDAQYRKELNPSVYGTDNPNVHNFYLQIWFGSGLVGLIALLGWWSAIFCWGIYVLWQTRFNASSLERNVLWGCLLGLVAQAMFGVFQNNLADDEVLISTIIFVSLLLHCSIKLLQHKTATT